MRNAKKVIRTKTYDLGLTPEKKVKYKEIELFPCDPTQDKSVRGRKEKVSRPSQNNLNDKNAKKHFRQIMKANFDDGDYFFSPTFDEEHLPEDIFEAQKYIKNFVRRLSRYCRKHGIELKYLHVLEEGNNGRVHPHFLVNGNIDRDELERMWRAGHANAKRIQLTNGKDIDAIAAYLSKDPKGRRRWTGSRNLVKPLVSKNDSKVSFRKFAELTLFPEDCEDARVYFEKQHPGYICTEIIKEWNEVTTTYKISAKLCLKSLFYKRQRKRE